LPEAQPMADGPACHCELARQLSPTATARHERAGIHKFEFLSPKAKQIISLICDHPCLPSSMALCAQPKANLTGAQRIYLDFQHRQGKTVKGCPREVYFPLDCVKNEDLPPLFSALCLTEIL